MAGRLYDTVNTQLQAKLNAARNQNNVTLKASTEAILDRLGSDLQAGKKLVQSVEVMKYMPDNRHGRLAVSAAKDALENIKTTKHSKIRAAMKGYYQNLGDAQAHNLLGDDLIIAIRENAPAGGDDTVKFIHAVDAVHELYDQLFNTGFNPATKDVQIEARLDNQLNASPLPAVAAKTSVSIENVRQLRDHARRVLYPYVAAFLRTFELNDVAIRRIYARADTNMAQGAATANLDGIDEALVDPVNIQFTRPAALAALGAFSQVSGPFSDTIVSNPAAMLALTSNPAIAKYGLGGLSFPMRIKVGSSGSMNLGMKGGAKKKSSKRRSGRRSGRKMTGGEQRAEQMAEELVGGDDMPSALNPFSAGGAKKRRSGKKKSSKRRVSGGAKKRSSKRRSGRKMTGGEQRAEQHAEELVGGKKRRSGKKSSKKSSKRRSSGGAKKRSSKRRSGRKN